MTVDEADHPEWWTPAELGKRWRKSPDTIIRKVRDGDIRAMQIGSSYRIHATEIARHEQKGLPPDQPVRVVKPVKSSGLLASFRARRAKLNA